MSETRLAGRIVASEVIQFNKDPNKKAFDRLHLRFLERAGAVQSGRAKGRIMTAKAQFFLVNLLTLVRNPESDVDFVCALITFVRVGKVGEVIPTLHNIVHLLRDSPNSVLGQHAAFALWDMGERAPDAEAFISVLLQREMFQQYGRMFPEKI